MADRTYRSGRDRYDRDRFDRDRGYSRQAEQFDATDYSWRDDERSYGQLGEGWRDEDYGQFDTAGQSYRRDREAARDWGRDPSYTRRSEFRTAGRDVTRPRFGTEYGAGSQLAANRGEWPDTYGATPSREHRDYRGTWGGRSGEGRGWLDRVSDTVEGWFGDDDDDRGRSRGYRGQGPSGYTRSDERIMEDACDALTEDWGVDASQISVTVNNGEVTLDGTVSSREQKRRAEDCVDDLSGVRNVQNNLRVQERTTWDRNNNAEFGSASNPTSSQT
jgi:osmotically-inducible protein OsmY